MTPKKTLHYGLKVIYLIIINYFNFHFNVNEQLPEKPRLKLKQL